MSHFRKMLFALVATASFMGFSGTANAQTNNPFVCSTSFSPLTVRAEGFRELIGDIVLTCTGGNSIGTPTDPIVVGNPAIPASGVIAAPPGVANPTVPAINISVNIAGGRITNRFVSSGTNLTDALLFIDEPRIPAPLYQANRNVQNPCTQFSPAGFIGTAGVCTGLSYFFEGGVATGAGVPSGQGGSLAGAPLNVFQGQYGVGGGFAPLESQITFVGIPVVQPGVHTGAGSRIYRIKNIRVRVAGRYQVGSQILASINIQNPPANLNLNNATGLVGFVSPGITFSATAGGPYAQCLGFNHLVSSGGQLSTTGAIRFTEGYGVSFKRRGVAGPLDTQDPVYNQFYNNFAPVGVNTGQSDPTVNYNTESGFYNLQYPTTNGLNVVGQASNGTRLRAVFSNVPAGVSVFVSLNPVAGVTIGGVTGPSTSAPTSAYAVSGTDSNGATALTFAPVSASGAFTGSGSVSGSAAPGFPGAPGAAYTAPAGMVSANIVYGQVTIGSNGSGTYVWEVLRSDDNTIDRVDFQVAIRFNPTTTIVTDVAAVTSQVAGSFAPLVSEASDLNNATIPSFASGELSPVNIFTIGNCATNLLYPFVSSVTGFNTGIAISNTSSDPFNTVPEAGVCLVNFYGDAAGGSVNPPQQRTSRAIPSGRVATFNLLFGNADWGITPVAGFQGYIIIQCNFRWAHGFAFISDPSNLQTAHGYLALILDPNGLGGSQLRRATGAPNAEQLDN